jgi:hypothetical protein
MLLLSPIWLIGLVPWSAAAVWLMWGRRRRTAVPFLPLWQGPVKGPRARRSMQPPPVAVALCLLAMLLALLAAARPGLSNARHGQGSLTIIVDRGLLMSGRGRTQPRFIESARAASEELARHFGPSAPVRAVLVPGTASNSDLSAWLVDLDKAAPTAADTRRVLPEVLAEALASASGPVIVISDQPLATADDRVLQVSPDRPPSDVAIIHLSARQQPAVQVMVRVRNQSPQTTAGLVVSTDDLKIEQRIELPAGGGQRDYFVDLPRLGRVISAELRVSDDVPANNTAQLVREGSSPLIESHAALPPELRRMIEVYQRARPASDASARVSVVSDVSQLPREGPAIVMAAERRRAPADARVQGTDHPIAEHVNWDQLRGPVCVGGSPPAGWSPVVSSGPQVLIAASPDPLKQVWVGFDAPRWATTPDYVIFWTNVFDWAGGGGERFVARQVDEWAPEWKPVAPTAGQAGAWPGVYRRSDGGLRAFNAPDVPVATVSATDWRARIATLARPHEGRLDLTPWLLVLSGGVLVIGAATWKRRRAMPVGAQSGPAGQSHLIYHIIALAPRGGHG